MKVMIVKSFVAQHPEGGLEVWGIGEDGAVYHQLHPVTLVEIDHIEATLKMTTARPSEVDSYEP
jgi:hypothetical protein